MNDVIQKYWFVGLIAIAAIVLLARRPSSGAAQGPAGSMETTQIDTAYEQIRAQADVQKAALAEQAYEALVGSDVAQAKFSTDITLANIEGGYALRMKQTEGDAATKLAGILSTSQQQIETQRSMVAVQTANINANANIAAAKAQASAQKTHSWLSTAAGIVGSILAFL